MKTSIIGYPRIGSLRELKFASEKYFRGEVSVSELQNTAKELRFAHHAQVRAQKRAIKERFWRKHTIR